jgi:cytochrome P450
MTQPSLLLVASSLLLFALWRAASFLLYKSVLRRNGCQEAPTYPHKEPFLGLDFFISFMNAFKGGYLLDFNKSMFDKYGKTFTVNSFGTKVIKTVDPEVSKAVHATFFANFGLQGLRYDTAIHLWGNGIIVVDGPRWKHGRALIRSSFDVVHVANMERLRKHTDVFLDLLPVDGSTVDLAPLFKRLVG